MVRFGLEVLPERMISRMYVARPRRCSCKPCTEWRMDISLPDDAACGICGTPNPSAYYTADWTGDGFANWKIAGYRRTYGPRFMPAAVRTFLHVDFICRGCRNSLTCHLNDGWGVCWSTTPEYLVQWALLDWMLSGWAARVRLAERGFRTRHEADQRDARWGQREEEVRELCSL